MSEDIPASGSGRGRPRSQEADRAILTATVELLAERGLAAMSIEEVAARAGVGKTTIYRRWPSKGLLALDAFVASFREEQPLPDTGTLRGDLLAALHAWVRTVTQTPMGPMLTGLIAFSLASLAGGLAQDPVLLIAARVVQGAGAAIVAPAALSLITTGFPEGPERTQIGRASCRERV